MFPQKDSHTLYLEQELESLKVVLEIKNEQLHQQEKKLMEVDKLVRTRMGGKMSKKKKEGRGHESLNHFIYF